MQALCNDANGNTLYTVTLDTLVAAGKAVTLPFGTDILGHNVTLRILGGGAQSGKGKINRVYIYRSRVLVGSEARWW